MEAVISASDLRLGSGDAVQAYLELERKFMETGFKGETTTGCSKKNIVGGEEGGDFVEDLCHG